MIEQQHLGPIRVNHDHQGDLLADVTAHVHAHPNKQSADEFRALAHGSQPIEPVFSGPDSLTFQSPKGTRYDVRPYFRALSAHEHEDHHYPLAGWAEMAYQGLAHASGIGRLVAPVHIVSAKTRTGPVPMYAVAHDPLRNAPIERLGHEQWTNTPTDLHNSAAKLAFLDFLTGNRHRSEKNLYYEQVPEGAPSQLVAKGHASAFQYKQPEGKDQLFHYFVDPFEHVAKNGAHPWDANHIEHAVEWWKRNGRALREELEYHLGAIHHGEVRAHIADNFWTRAEALDRFSRLWGTLKDPDQYSPYANSTRSSGTVEVPVRPHQPVFPFGAPITKADTEAATYDRLAKKVEDNVQAAPARLWYEDDPVRFPTKANPERHAWNERYMQRLHEVFGGPDVEFKQVKVPIELARPFNRVMRPHRRDVYQEMFQNDEDVPPAMFRPDNYGGGWQILDGSHRWDAAKRAGKKFLDGVYAVPKNGTKKSEELPGEKKMHDLAGDIAKAEVQMADCIHCGKPYKEHTHDEQCPTSTPKQPKTYWEGPTRWIAGPGDQGRPVIKSEPPQGPTDLGSKIRAVGQDRKLSNKLLAGGEEPRDPARPWHSGECFTFAHALHQHLPGSSIVGLYPHVTGTGGKLVPAPTPQDIEDTAGEYSGWNPQHAVVQHNGRYYDADGEVAEQTLRQHHHFGPLPSWYMEPHGTESVLWDAVPKLLSEFKRRVPLAAAVKKSEPPQGPAPMKYLRRQSTRAPVTEHDSAPWPSLPEDYEHDRSTGQHVVFHHGTPHQFDQFEPGHPGHNTEGIVGLSMVSEPVQRTGVFFSHSPGFAQSFASQNGAKGRMVRAHLALGQTADLDASVGDLPDHVQDRLYSTRDKWRMFDGEEGKNFVEHLKQAGYDSARFEENGDDGESHLTHVVFDPSQIRQLPEGGTLTKMAPSPQKPSSTYKGTNRHVRALIDKHGGQTMPFHELPGEAQAAIRHRRSEVMDVNEDQDAGLHNAYFGLVHVPTKEASAAVVASSEDIQKDHKTFDRYHRWYVGQGDVPDHKNSVWPVEFEEYPDALIHDGWHRFHSYYRKGLSHIPFIWHAG